MSIAEAFGLAGIAAGLFAITIGVLGYLGKVALERLFAVRDRQAERDHQLRLQEFQDELRRRSEVELLRLKNGLEQAARLDATRFQYLTERRLNVLVDMYVRLSEACQAIEDATGTTVKVTFPGMDESVPKSLTVSASDQMKKLVAAGLTLVTFQDEFRRTRIFFPQSTVALVEKFLRSYSILWAYLASGTEKVNTISDETQINQQVNRLRSDFREILHEHIAPVIAKIELDFRQLMGVAANNPL